MSSKKTCCNLDTRTRLREPSTSFLLIIPLLGLVEDSTYLAKKNRAATKLKWVKAIFITRWVETSLLVQHQQVTIEAETENWAVEHPTGINWYKEMTSRALAFLLVYIIDTRSHQHKQFADSGNQKQNSSIRQMAA